MSCTPLPAPGRGCGGGNRSIGSRAGLASKGVTAGDVAAAIAGLSGDTGDAPTRISPLPAPLPGAGGWGHSAPVRKTRRASWPLSPAPASPALSPSGCSAAPTPMPSPRCCTTHNKGGLGLALAHQTGYRVRLGVVAVSSAAMMRGRSAAGRFWLSLNLPSQRAMAIF